MATQPVPLRLWADGDVFRSCIADGGRQRINQAITSGVELLGDPGPSADVELVRLLLAAAGSLGLRPEHRPTLLVGHHGVLQALLHDCPEQQRHGIRRALTGFDRLGLQQQPLTPQQQDQLQNLLALRGDATTVLAQLRTRLGACAPLEQLAQVLAWVEPAAQRHGVRVQLDPTFQPHFDLYDGLVLKLVCQGEAVPVAVASGGRYDALVGRFSTNESRRTLPAAGVGFGFDVEQLRDLLQAPAADAAPVLVAYAHEGLLAEAIDRLEQLHGEGRAAELHGSPLANRQLADRVAGERHCSGVDWLGG